MSSRETLTNLVGKTRRYKVVFINYLILYDIHMNDVIYLKIFFEK